MGITNDMTKDLASPRAHVQDATVSAQVNLAPAQQPAGKRFVQRADTANRQDRTGGTIIMLTDSPSVFVEAEP